MRMGKIRNPQYRIVVADSRTKRDGRAIENIGLYYPKEDPSRIEVNSERVQYWLSVGAQPSDPVLAILRRTGDWQRFKGLPAPSRPVQVAEPRADRNAVYEAEVKAAIGLAEAGKAEKAKKSGKSDKSDKTDRVKSEKADKADNSDKAEADKSGKAPGRAGRASKAAKKPAGADAGDQAEAATSEGAAPAGAEEQVGASSGEQS
jgi:small subunit ribosomal protein S16